MAFFSYAASFEDALLNRAFKDIERGFYIEVGARHPIEGSVTYALYQRGWHGITIEPKGEVADLFVNKRPADTHLLLLAAAQNRSEVAYHSWLGQDVKPASASTLREERLLKDILATYAPREIHLLAIRTRQTLDVLNGADLSGQRPWVLLIGAVDPVDVEPINAFLSAHAYKQAHFDGINRFFLATEHFDRLAHHFIEPLNANDDIVTVRGGTDSALALALAERDRLAGKLERANHLRRLAEESASMSLGLRPNWPRKLDLPRRAGLQVFEEQETVQISEQAEDLAITLTGHVNGSYSLASVNRDYAAALARFSKAYLRLEPVEGDRRGGVEGVPGPERALVERLVNAPAKKAKMNVAISQHYPPLVPEGAFDLKLMVFFWEESIVPSHLVEVINEGFDAVLVATRFVAKVLVDSGVSIPVRVVRHPGRFKAFDSLRTERMERGAKGKDEETIFLHVSSCFPRKGVDRLLDAYLSAFSADDPVRLIIKGFPNPHNEVADEIAAARQRMPNRAAVTFLNEDMDEERLLGLYRRADVLVLPTRGEGLNLPAAEALISGLPLIVTGFGAHLDFCAADTVRLVDFSFAPSASHLATPGSVWAEPDGEDLKAALVSMRQRLVTQPFMPAKDDADAFFDREHFARRIEGVIDELTHPWWPEKPSLRMAWVSSYEVRCGIAEYSRHLITALKPLGATISVLSDQRTVPDLPTPPELEELTPVWEVNNPETMPATADELARLCPDVVVIQYHPAYLAWDGIEVLIEEAKRQKALVIVTLHNVRWLARQVLSIRKAAREALNRADRIIVHTVLDLNFLKQLGFIDNVVLLPQGVALLDHRDGVSGVAISSAPLIGCYGFFLPHKGIHSLIEALSDLRRTYPGARLRLVNSEYPAPVSASEIMRCKALAERLGLMGAIEWHTDFLPHEASIALLAQCDVVVLPYEDTNEASSAAARSALSSRRPVVVTPIQIFEELGSAAYRLPGGDAARISAGLSSFLADQSLRQSTLDAAFQWLERHDWKAIGKRFHGMILGLTKSEDRRH